VTDDALRATERALVSAPADLELRRRHARLLQRAGQEERALSALDLAWRLGADELWDELQDALAARALRLGEIELRYVPAGPFVLGGDDGDEDEGPARLIELSAFHVASELVTSGQLRESPAWASWMDGAAHYPVNAWTHGRALEVVEAAGALARAAGLQGRLGLISEARWERVARAALLREDGVSPYGVVGVHLSGMLEWTADAYQPDAYARAGARDPVEGRPSALRVVRGPPLPEPHRSRYREAVAPSGQFSVEQPAGWLRRSLRLGDPRTHVRHEPGLGVRVVLEAM
jgi:formylglycine-generating enzyme required for sulfatase activity